MLAPWDVVRIPAWLDEESAELLQLPVGSVVIFQNGNQMMFLL